MRSLERNKQQVNYALLIGQVDVTDEYGNKTGEYELEYSDPVPLRINVSPAKGAVYSRAFGDDITYDRVMVTSQMDLPIDEETVFWIESTDEPDYKVTRVAKGLNSVSYAIRKLVGT